MGASQSRKPYIQIDPTQHALLIHKTEYYQVYQNSQGVQYEKYQVTKSQNKQYQNNNHHLNSNILAKTQNIAKIAENNQNRIEYDSQRNQPCQNNLPQSHNSSNNHNINNSIDQNNHNKRSLEQQQGFSNQSSQKSQITNTQPQTYHKPTFQQHYNYRLTNRSKYFVQLLYAAPKQKSSFNCNFAQQTYTVVTERISYRLSELYNLSFDNALAVLYVSLKGFRNLFNFNGAFWIRDTMIGINQKNEIRVWLNSNFSLNIKQELPVSLSRLSSQQQEELIVNNLIDMVSSKTNVLSKQWKQLMQLRVNMIGETNSDRNIRFDSKNKQSRRMSFDLGIELVQRVMGIHGLQQSIAEGNKVYDLFNTGEERRKCYRGEIESNGSNNVDQEGRQLEIKRQDEMCKVPNTQNGPITKANTRVNGNFDHNVMNRQTSYVNQRNKIIYVQNPINHRPKQHYIQQNTAYLNHLKNYHQNQPVLLLNSSQNNNKMIVSPNLNLVRNNVNNLTNKNIRLISPNTKTSHHQQINTNIHTQSNSKQINTNIHTQSINDLNRNPKPILRQLRASIIDNNLSTYNKVVKNTQNQNPNYPNYNQHLYIQQSNNIQKINSNFKPIINQNYNYNVIDNNSSYSNVFITNNNNHNNTELPQKITPIAHSNHNKNQPRLSTRSLSSASRVSASNINFIKPPVIKISHSMDKPIIVNQVKNNRTSTIKVNFVNNTVVSKSPIYQKRNNHIQRDSITSTFSLNSVINTMNDGRVSKGVVDANIGNRNRIECQKIFKQSPVRYKNISQRQGVMNIEQNKKEQQQDIFGLGSQTMNKQVEFTQIEGNNNEQQKGSKDYDEDKNTNIKIEAIISVKNTVGSLEERDEQLVVVSSKQNDNDNGKLYVGQHYQLNRQQQQYNRQQQQYNRQQQQPQLQQSLRQQDQQQQQDNAGIRVTINKCPSRASHSSSSQLNQQNHHIQHYDNHKIDDSIQEFKQHQQFNNDRNISNNQQNDKQGNKKSQEQIQMEMYKYDLRQTQNLFSNNNDKDDHDSQEYRSDSIEHLELKQENKINQIYEINQKDHQQPLKQHNTQSINQHQYDQRSQSQTIIHKLSPWENNQQHQNQPKINYITTFKKHLSHQQHPPSFQTVSMNFNNQNNNKINSNNQYQRKESNQVQNQNLKKPLNHSMLLHNGSNMNYNQLKNNNQINSEIETHKQSTNTNPANYNHSAVQNTQPISSQINGSITYRQLRDLLKSTSTTYSSSSPKEIQ